MKEFRIVQVWDDRLNKGKWWQESSKTIEQLKEICDYQNKTKKNGYIKDWYLEYREV